MLDVRGYLRIFVGRSSICVDPGFFGMAGRPCSRPLGVDSGSGRGVRRGSGAPPKLLNTYIFIAIQTSATYEFTNFRWAVISQTPVSRDLIAPVLSRSRLEAQGGRPRSLSSLDTFDDPQPWISKAPKTPNRKKPKPSQNPPNTPANNHHKPSQNPPQRTRGEGSLFRGGVY